MSKLCPVALLLALAAGAASGNTFRDTGAGIEIDLPEGYAERNRQTKKGVTSVTLKSDDGPAINLIIIPIEADFDGPAEVFESQMAGIESSLSGAVARELHDFELSGYPARWGGYRARRAIPFRSTWASVSSSWTTFSSP